MKALISLIIISFIYFSMSLPIPIRGIVEGFYGTPWTFEDRADIINFSYTVNLNSYIYAPKDDPYHRGKWRLPYPEEKIKELENLIKIAKENEVQFVFAVSPGLDLHYEGEEAEKDFNSLMTKLDSLYVVGCRNFAIFFDDISIKEGDGIKHAQFLNKLQEALDKKYSDSNALITVPTEYSRLNMIDKDGNVKEYTKGFVQYIDKKIIVLYTGDGVVCDGISDEQYKMATDIYKRNLGIWWNYPVNDYLKTKRALGPIEKLPTSNIDSIFYNPMEQVQLSKISLATGADYALSPDTYNSEKSWKEAIETQYGNVAKAMLIFARHSRHMQTKWAIVGPPDAPEFYQVAHQAVKDVKEKIVHDFSRLIKLLDEMELAADVLLQKLPQQILSECKPQLYQFKRIIYADRVAVDSLKKKKLDPELKNLRQDITDHENEATISDKSAVKFIDEVIELYEPLNVKIYNG